ncbi:MAG: pyruvate dehydrogenase (acetyl-transferring) E1 component subunit alpha [Chlamydiae bacterium GWA2_50_15]|nr:MAG: pyruvate dehydrogenase (acetyl-transferring) E1 component subunit alpha [Chlamydiae bacterium GWA2_50_15]
MTEASLHPEYNYFSCDPQELLKKIGKERLLKCLKEMLLIRNFEVRGEAAYQTGKVGGFYHSYMGQEAIQTAAVEVMGKDNWWTTTYRCHALALLLGATPNELMAELYGRATGNAKGRGGSMHFFTDRMLGGFGIVGGHIPIATGAAFTIKYKKKRCVSVCFLGDGAVAQGAFHEALNLASLWDLPVIFVIENNQWGMGTAVERAVCVKPIAEKKAGGYRMNSYTVDGMDFFSCFACFEKAYEEVMKTSRPVLIEAVTERFRGHSISDPGLYRAKETVKEIMQQDPIHFLLDCLIHAGMLSEDEYKEMDKAEKEKVLSAIKFADESPWPDPVTLGEDVLADGEGRV